MNLLTLLRVLTQTLFKALTPLRLLFSYLLIISTEYSTNTSRTLILLSILKLGKMIIVAGILIHTDSSNN